MINSDIIRNAKNLNNLFNYSLPYPHIVIDNFIQKDILNDVLNELLTFNDWSFDEGLTSFQVNKFYVPATDSDESMKKSLDIIKNKAPIAFKTLNYLYSDDVMNFMTTLTGIPNLQPDKSWFGAGIHKIVNDGRLAIHSDFNLNWKTNKYRRANLLLYLNKDWKDEYNGHLELWETDMSKCALKIAPIFNRAVIFNTDKTSYHGHTQPLNVPPGIARYSLALYYYSDVPPKNDEEQRFVTWKNTV